MIRQPRKHRSLRPRRRRRYVVCSTELAFNGSIPVR
jgi:hypothetical protein